MNALNAFNSSSPVPEIDETLLRYLTPGELEELDQLIAPPVDVVSTLPLSVLCAILHAHEHKIGRKGGELVQGGEPATHPTEFPDVPGQIRLDLLDLPEPIMAQILDAFKVGYWRGEVRPEIVPSQEWEREQLWLEMNAPRLDQEEGRLPNSMSIRSLQCLLKLGPTSDDALAVYNTVQKLRETSQTHQVRFCRDSATRMDLG